MNWTSNKSLGILCITLCLGNTIYAQDSLRSSTVANEMKVYELKNKLDGISKSIETTEMSDREYLKSLDKEVNNLAVAIKELKQSQDSIAATQSKNHDEVMDLLNLLLEEKGISRTNTSNKGLQNRDGKYYVVIEAQRTLEQSQKAKATLLAKFSDLKINIIRSKSGRWYFLTLDNATDYKSVLSRLNKVREEKVKEAWWVNTNDLEK